MKKLLSCLLAAVCLLVSLAVGISPATVEELAAPLETTKQADNANNSLPTYRQYSTTYEAVYPTEQYVIVGGSGRGKKVEVLKKHEGKNNVLKLGENGAVTYTVDVEEAGYYRLMLTYIAVPAKGKDMVLSLKLNGKMPFDKAQSLEFNRLWKNETGDSDFERDSRDNDILPDQVEVFRWIDRDLRDVEGSYSEPFFFHFKKGENTIELINGGEAMVIGALTLHAAEEIPAYTAPTEGVNAVEDFTLLLEGEKASLKSSNTIIPTYNKGDPATSPASPTYIRRNTIGNGTSWSGSNKYVIWQFEVPTDGYYKIGIKYAQSQNRGLSSYRRVYIDGKVMYDELNEVEFAYTAQFKNQVLSADGEEMLFYLTAGKTHELKMEVNIGDTAEGLRILNEALDTMNRMYRKIIMVTGVTPDTTRDYTLEEEIPELLDTFTEVADTIESQYDVFVSDGDKGGSMIITLSEIVDKLREYVEEPYTIAERLSAYRDSLSSLATWLNDREAQPLEVDYVMVLSPDEEMPKATSNFLQKVAYEWNGFIGSFTQDYVNVGDANPDDVVEVWISAGREQSLIVRELVDSQFYAKTGIPVSVKLVKGGLVQCVMAGEGPDVALSQDRGLPVNLALRNAVMDLSHFEGFEEVTKQFASTAMEPYEFNGGYYALPETQSFHMMFYRTDIFEELGIEPPDNWEDFYKVINIIQRNNMEVGLPYSIADNMFNTLLLQNGGSFYNKEKTASTLRTEAGFKAFQQWVDFYDQYSFSMVKDDYNRFRTGEMPLTIMQYTFYTQLRVAAPEINGLWEMVQIPGTVQKNGSVSRSEAATGTANVIFKSASNPENAWQFLKWWSSAEVQAAYGQKIETVLGAAGRYATANLEAVTMLPWSEAELAAIDEQRRWVQEIPEVAGGYYMTRNINNAFLAVINRGENLREVLSYWDDQTNREITRKRRELGLDVE